MPIASHAAELAAPHHHYVIFASFVMGYFLHVWLQVNSIVRATPDEITTNFVVSQNAPRLAVRFFISMMAFLVIWGNPSSVPAILKYVGLSLSDDAVALLTLPMNIPIAGGLGVFIDVLLGFVPMLKNALPPIEFTRVEKKVETSVKETTTVSTHTETAAAPAGDVKPELKPGIGLGGILLSVLLVMALTGRL